MAAGRPKKRTDGKCLKCGEEPAEEGQSWGRKCLTDYQRSRQNIMAEQTEGKGFARGAEAAYVTLADEFDRFPGIRLTCDEVADKIRRAPRPVYRRNGNSEPPPAPTCPAMK